MAQYSIKDLENVTNIKAHTIRIWEQRYNIFQPLRTETNIRIYSDDDLTKLLIISTLNRNGWKISRIMQLSFDQMKEKLMHLTTAPQDADTKIDALLIAMIELDEKGFEDQLNSAVLTLGFDYTFVNILSKLLQKAGLLWLTGSINPAQEHFVSNIVRSKLIVAIHSVLPQQNLNPSKFLMFLPEGEWHELGLLYAMYMIKKRGHQILYLGQNTPQHAAIEAAGKWNPVYVVVSILSKLNQENWYDLYENIVELFQGYKLIMNVPDGSMIQDRSSSLQIIKNYSELSQFLDGLS